MLQLNEISYDYYSKQITKDQYNIILDLDPTTDKMYCKWLIPQFIKKNLDGYHDSYITNTLTSYNEYKENKVLPPEYKDINAFKTFEMLEKYLYTNKSSLDAALKKKVASKNKEVSIWYEDDKVLLVSPKTYASSREYGGDARWCTAGSSGDYYFNLYSKYGVVLLIHRLKDPNRPGKFLPKAFQLYIPNEEGINNDEDNPEYFNRVWVNDINNNAVDNINDLNFYEGLPPELVTKLEKMIEAAGGNVGREEEHIQNVVNYYLRADNNVDSDLVIELSLYLIRQDYETGEVLQDIDARSNSCTMTYVSEDVGSSNPRIEKLIQDSSSFNMENANGLLLRYVKEESDEQESFDRTRRDALRNWEYDDEEDIETYEAKKDLRDYLQDKVNIRYIITKEDDDDIIQDLFTAYYHESREGSALGELFGCPDIRKLFEYYDYDSFAIGNQEYTIYYHPDYDYEAVTIDRVSTVGQRRRDRQQDLDYGF